MLNRQSYVTVLAVLSLLVACSKKNQLTDEPEQPIAPPPDFGFKVVGYMPNYRDPATIPDSKFRMTNVVNYAFATVNSSGVPVVSNPARFQLVVNKAKANKAKIFIS